MCFVQNQQPHMFQMNSNKNTRVLWLQTKTKCSYAFEERITIKIYRDNCDNYIQSDQTLGSRNFTGGFIGKYSGSFIDTPNITTQVKYYITFQLENNNSETRQGIYKFNSIIFILY